MYSGNNYVSDRALVSPANYGSTHSEQRNVGYVNHKELRVIGLSRSGNHAIINWILNQAKGRTCFLNCAEGKTNPFVSARPLHHGLPYAANYSKFNLEQEQAGAFITKDLLIHSYEDSFLGYVCHPVFEQHHDQWVGKSSQRYDVLILRDPFNLFASRKRAGDALAGVTPATAIRIWMQHAREFMGPPRYLNQTRILINYNRWATERCYRQKLAMQLGVDFTDAGINTVPATAGGSSFDGSRYNGAARQMKTLERWKVYRDDPSYWQLLRPEVLDYALQLFSPLPSEESLLQSATTALTRQSNG
jgi:hypothetical protein